MIVSVQTPAGTKTVIYGQCSMLPDGAGKLDLPDYVAKTVCSLSGFTSTPSLASSAATLLANTQEADKWTANYLLLANGKRPTGDNDADYSAAVSLMSSKGEPAVSAT